MACRGSFGSCIVVPGFQLIAVSRGDLLSTLRPVRRWRCFRGNPYTAAVLGRSAKLLVGATMLCIGAVVALAAASNRRRVICDSGTVAGMLQLSRIVII